MEWNQENKKDFTLLFYGLLLLSFLSYEYTLYYNAYQMMLMSIVLTGSLTLIYQIGDNRIRSLYYESIRHNKLVYFYSLSILISFVISSFIYNYSSLIDWMMTLVLLISLWLFYLFLPVLIKDMEKILTFLIIVITFFSSISIVIGLTGSFLIYTPTHFPRISSIFFDPNYFGAICSVGIVLALTRNKVYKLLGAVNFIALIYSGSRASILSLAVVIILLNFYGKPFNFKSLLVFSFIIGSSLLVVEYLESINFFRSYQGLSGRNTLWKKSWELIREAPTWGYGPGGINILYTNHNLSNGSSHNAFIDFVIEHGVFPLLFYVGIIVKGVYAGVKNNVNPSIIKCIILLLVNANSITITVGGVGATSFLLTLFLGYCNAQIIKDYTHDFTTFV